MITWPIYLGIVVALILTYLSNKRESDAIKKEEYEKEKAELLKKKMNKILEGKYSVPRDKSEKPS
jgi:hypothetical protein